MVATGNEYVELNPEGAKSCYRSRLFIAAASVGSAIVISAIVIAGVLGRRSCVTGCALPTSQPKFVYSQYRSCRSLLLLRNLGERTQFTDVLNQPGMIWFLFYAKFDIKSIWNSMIYATSEIWQLRSERILQPILKIQRPCSILPNTGTGTLLLIFFCVLARSCLPLTCIFGAHCAFFERPRNCACVACRDQSDICAFCNCTGRSTIYPGNSTRPSSHFATLR
jgi:hypothetical protein